MRRDKKGTIFAHESELREIRSPEFEDVFSDDETAVMVIIYDKATEKEPKLPNELVK